jgi:hypothetical protein
MRVSGLIVPAAALALQLGVAARQAPPAPAPAREAADRAAFQPLVGVWVFNPARSTADPDRIPFRRGTCRIEPWADGFRVVYDLVRLRGGITHLEWVGKLDGRDYPLQGVDADVTNAYRRIDERTYEIVQKVNGVVALVERLALSPDGRTITTMAPVSDAQGRTTTLTTVYEKP